MPGLRRGRTSQTCRPSLGGGPPPRGSSRSGEVQTLENLGFGVFSRVQDRAGGREAQSADGVFGLWFVIRAACSNRKVLNLSIKKTDQARRCVSFGRVRVSLGLGRGRQAQKKNPDTRDRKGRSRHAADSGRILPVCPSAGNISSNAFLTFETLIFTVTWFGVAGFWFLGFRI